MRDYKTGEYRDGGYLCCAPDIVHGAYSKIAHFNIEVRRNKSHCIQFTTD